MHRLAKKAPKVYVILWFDTEDYILPASDKRHACGWRAWLIPAGHFARCSRSSANER